MGKELWVPRNPVAGGRQTSTAGLQGTAPGTLEARRIVPGLAGQRTLLKGKSGEAALSSRPGSRVPPREENKGAERVSRQHPRRPHQELESRSRPVARHPDLSPPAWPFRAPKALPPLRPSSSYPVLSSQTAPAQFKAGRGQSQARPRPSSSQEAAGRAGRARQATQEKPRFVPPLPPRGPGDSEARGSLDRRKPAHFPSRARGSSGPTIQRPARCCRRRWGEAASIAIPDGEGRRVRGELGGEAEEGRRARQGRSKWALLAATRLSATWGAAETRRPAAPGRQPAGGVAAPPGRSGLPGLRLPRPCGCRFSVVRPDALRFAVTANALPTPHTLVHASPAGYTFNVLLLRAPCFASKLRPNLSLSNLPTRRPRLTHEPPLLPAGRSFLCTEARRGGEKRLSSVPGDKSPIRTTRKKSCTTTLERRS
ncbi:uncharacterized protein AAES06_025017 [Glossophaga mutica]